MDQLPYIVAYVALAVFACAVVMRFYMFSKLPMHVRWELYPVAHEASKAHYGGSYLEDTDWWKKSRETSMLAELKVMVPEILFLVALKEHNPKMWRVSFPFHFGLYIVIGATALMLAHGVLFAIAPEALTGSAATYVQTGIVFLTVAGLGLGLLGALGLLQRRLTAPELEDYTAPADIFNLVFFIVAFGCALATFIVADRDGTTVLLFSHNLVTGNLQALPGAGLEAVLPVASIILFSALTAYVPLTHMSHFIGKYFAYHAIRWNDEPNLAGGDQEEEIQELLGRPVSWAAAHIRSGGGKRTWAEVATDPTTPPKKEKKEEKK